MRDIVIILLIGLGTTGLAVAAGSSSETPLAIGDDAPAFSLAGSDGETYRLSDYAGRRAVVIAWFPKAFTGG